MSDQKVRENRLRRMASRRGLVLSKSHRRDPEALDYGSYWMSDQSSSLLIAGGEWGMSLDDVEAFLNGEWDEAEAEEDDG